MPRPHRLSLAALLAVPALAPAATTLNIVTDTYLDSFVDPKAGAVSDNAHTNYGHFGAVKAVTNDGSGSDFPNVDSFVHGVFTLPGQAVTETAGGVASAVVTYRSRNNSPAGHLIELHPLLHNFVEGAGGDASISKAGPSTATAMGGSYNPTAAAAAKGADWYTYDGTNAWSTAGGSYDAAFVTGTVSGSGSAIYYSFNITGLLNNPTTRAEILTNGLLMKTDRETPTSGNDFVSFYSADYGKMYDAGSVTYDPTVTYAVPEPAALGGLACATLLATRRRSRDVS